MSDVLFFDFSLPGVAELAGIGAAASVTIVVPVGKEAWIGVAIWNGVEIAPNKPEFWGSSPKPKPPESV